MLTRGRGDVMGIGQSLRAGLLVTGMAAAAAAQGTNGGAAAPAPDPGDVRETVVVVGSVSPDAYGSLGRTLVLLSRQDLARLPLSNPIDALRLVPSVEVRERGARGVQADFAIRGAAFGQALVLVNGARLNDAQSGHHNGDIPVSLLDVERVEVLLGGGASVHGADAVGGAINVVTRRAGPRFAADIAAGQHDLVEGSAAVSLGARPVAHVFSGEFNRSTGFMPHRDHDVKLARYQGTIRQDTTLTAGYLDKEFGANGFYGPSPSREWTDQTLISAEHRFDAGGSLASIDGAYRSHGDRFVYDWRNPSLSDNRHRTHAFSVNGRWRRALAAPSQLSLGVSAGHDAIDSTNLGDRSYARVGGVAELRQAIGSRVVVQPGIRVDGYSDFGTAWSPAVAATGWIVPSLRWRTATGRTFRVPTYTELYYRDPNHLASSDLRPERAWSADGGLDLFEGPWTASATAFGRWEEDVIDWVRLAPTEPWRTTNIREVDTQGVELALSQRVGSTGLWTVRYTGQQADASALALLSKYVLDYAPHALSLSGAATWRRMDVGSHVTFTRRADGRDYWVVDLRIGRGFGRAEVYVDVANAFDEAYQEVKGVDMPGRWVKAGLRLR